MAGLRKVADSEQNGSRSRIYHLLIVGAATMVLVAGAMWEGRRTREEPQNSELSAIESLKKEVSGVRSVLMRNELETVRDATREIVDSVAGSVVAIEPARPVERLRNIPVYGMAEPDVNPLPSPASSPSVSGLIVDQAGHIITSETAAAHGREVRISFGKTNRTGEVIAVDAQHHLALIRAREMPGSVRPAALESVEGPRSGDWLIGVARAHSGEAVGSLHVFGSIRDEAGGRQIGVLASPATAQMDGAVLVNLQRQIVGLYVRPPHVDGFSIPIALAFRIANELKTKPPAEIRGWAGLVLQDLTDDLREYFQATSGVLVASVDEAGPAAKAGLRPMDLIQVMQNQQVASAAAAMTIIDQSAPGTTLSLMIQRGSAKRAAQVVVAAPPASAAHNDQANDAAVSLEVGPTPRGEQGIMIVSAEPMPYFARIGVTEGDVILTVNGTPLRNAAQFWTLQSRPNAGRPQLWRVSRDGRAFFVAVKARVGRL